MKNKTVLVICESGYWRDLREGLAAVNVDFLGFDKKKPHRDEIDQLVVKADFVVIRNLNVAHHSVRFAKEAAKATATPFWVGSSFGVEKIISKLKELFPEENFVTQKQDVTKKKSVTKKSAKVTPKLQKSGEFTISPRKKNLSLKKLLKDVKIDEDDIDFSKMFKS